MKNTNTVVKFPARQRLVCSDCGASGTSSCDCGAPYVPAGKRAAAAIAANPTKSDRAIAEEIGVSHPTVAKARTSTGKTFPVGKRTGQDGKTRKLPIKRVPTQQQEIQIFLKQVSDFMDDFTLRLIAWHYQNLDIESEAKFALVHSLSTRSMQLQNLAQTIDGREDDE